MSPSFSMSSAPASSAAPILDGAVDVVGRHVLGLRGVDGGAQAGVAARIPAALLGSDRDFANQTREYGTTPLIGDRLLSLDLFPLIVTSHTLLRTATYKTHRSGSSMSSNRIQRR